jgi:hypothetical protein
MTNPTERCIDAVYVVLETDPQTNSIILVGVYRCYETAKLNLNHNRQLLGPTKLINTVAATVDHIYPPYYD